MTKGLLALIETSIFQGCGSWRPDCHLLSEKRVGRAPLNLGCFSDLR
jgi:hypothetical protein